LRGAAQEIFHEGICVPGLKIVEKDEFREDVFQTLTGMCRDPHRYLRGYRHSRVGRILLSLRRRDECVVRWYDLGSALKVEAMRA